MLDILGRFQKLHLLLLLLVGFAFIVSGCEKLDDEDPPPLPSSYHIPAPYPESTTSETTETSSYENQGYSFVSESLKDGETSGYVSDGYFTGDGLQLSGGDGFIRYSIPTTSSGYVEFSASGFIPGEIYGGSEFKAVLLTMWSGNDGYSYESAPFIFELRKYGYIEGRPDASDSLIFKIKSNGVWEAGAFHVLSWSSSKTYRFRIEWSGGQAQAFRDEILVATGTYYGEFAPGNHQVQIGAQPLKQKESPHNLLISDVVIGAL